MSNAYLYAFLLLLSAHLSGVIGYVAWRRRCARGAIPLIILSAGLMWWSFTYALHWLFSVHTAETFWLDLTYVGVVAAPTSFLTFALLFTQRAATMEPRQIVFLSIEPVLTCLLLWTDPWHGFFFGGARPSQPEAILSGGPWFYINLIYSYTLVAVALFILARAFVRSPRFQRNQTATILAGAMMPILLNLASLTGHSPFPNLDLAPLGFTLTALFFALGLFTFRMLEIVPIARSLVLESMPDGVLVLDTFNRIVDINAGACRMIGIPLLEAAGQPGSLVLPGWEELSTRYPDVSPYHDVLTVGAPPRYVEINITPIADARSQPLGTLVILRDTTEKVKAEEKLRRMNADLQKKIEEIEGLQAELRERATRDPLTGLFNRRHMEEMLSQEAYTAERNRQPLSLVYLDVDSFKRINDRFDHEGGDAILQGLGDLLREQTQPGDWACRIGGDEFVLIIPHASLEAACQRAERLCNEFARRFRSYRGIDFNATISLGVSAYPDHGLGGEKLLRAADQAMYLAKRNGHNQVAIYQP